LIVSVILIATPFFAHAQSAQGSVFPDIATTYKYYPAIEYLKNNNIVAGYPDGTYRPSRAINRAEFLAIVLKSQGFTKSDEKNCFPDVREEWFADDVCFALKNKYVSGHPDGFFRPAENINFVEAATILTRAYKYPVDARNNERWYHKFVTALEATRAVPREITSFNHLVTRGGMAEMIWRIQARVAGKSFMTYTTLRRIERGEDPATEPNFEAQLADYLQQNDIELTASERLEEVDEQTVHEIKALATMYILHFLELHGEDALPSHYDLLLRRHRGVVYMIAPFAQKYFVYPVLDAATAHLIDPLGNATNRLDSRSARFIRDKDARYEFDDRWQLEYFGESEF